MTALADSQVLRTDGTAAPLADAWREGPAVLFFLRHYG
jgi:hypothetical protein